MDSHTGEMISDNVHDLADGDPTDDTAANCSEMFSSAVSGELNSGEEDDPVFTKDTSSQSQFPSDARGAVFSSGTSAQGSKTAKSNGDVTSSPTVTKVGNNAPDHHENSGSQGQVLSPTATSGNATGSGTRRPSYTSKAPSALTNLPGITVSDFSPQQYFSVVSPGNQNGTSHPSLLNITAKVATQPSSPRPNLASIRQKSHESVGSFGQSFDESLDGYSNPGTPSSIRADSPTASPSNGNHGQSLSKHMDIREKNRLAFKTKWDEAIKTDVLTVKCRDMTGSLYKHKLGSGSKGKCIKTVDGQWITPTEFEARAGRKACKDWKRSIRYAGQTLQKLIDENILCPHAVSCTCATCCGDETLTGPVKLFVPYKGKRKRPHDACSVSKPDDLNHDHHRVRSMSVDSEVFLHRQGSLNNDDASNIPPMTPVTPMTPITPVTPFTPMTPLTPCGVKPNSPPRSVTIHAPSGLSMLGSVTTTTTSAGISSMGGGRPPATPTRVQAVAGDPSLNIVNHQHWIQLEEVASSILSMAQQLKIMIDQAKVQSEAMRESAVAQARIQAETDKREAISQIRYQSLAQLSQALATAQAEKSENPLERAQVSQIKSCQNCGREAPLECTGCYKIYYCGTFCQKKDWVNHQKLCRESANDQYTMAIISKEQPH